ncbi:MAG: DUF1624 domain-containing protein [Elusimicrobia bacterium]|nr:DUF1624 domain-containing protein [Elusimicrobiota bacterium]
MGDAIAARGRVESVDLMRGVVMAIMALDHVRIFFHKLAASTSMANLAGPDAANFLTRWITHICAPVFFLLVGTGSFFSLQGGKTKAELSGFLFKRGAWLLLLEFTVVQLGWDFDLRYQHMTVIWALGCSMIALAGLARLPVRAVAVIGAAVIAGHNLLDGVQSRSFGPFHWAWLMLHQLGRWEITPDFGVVVNYPLLAWVGITAAGYGLGELWSRDSCERRRILLIMGMGAVAAFVLIRALNSYGDPDHFYAQGNGLYTVLSFLNCRKYPPSLLYSLMTLGPAFLLLAIFEKRVPRLLRPFLVIGRVPLFYYLLHIPLIHGLALIFAFARYGDVPWWHQSLRPPGFPFHVPDGYGYGLPAVYLVWGLVVGLLYPLCVWFAGVKKRRRAAWLSYL